MKTIETPRLKCEYEQHWYRNIGMPDIYPSELTGKELKNVRDLYAYSHDGVLQYYVIDKPKNHFVVNHFCYNANEHTYWQNVAIDFDTRKEAIDFIEKRIHYNVKRVPTHD